MQSWMMMPRSTLVFMNSPLISPQPDFFDRLFYLYGDHIELIRFKEYYGMPRGHEQDSLYLLSIRNMVYIYGLIYGIFLGTKVIIITP